MSPIAITVTGRLGDDPRTFSTREGTAGVELRLAVEVPGRTGDSITRWVKVTAFGVLASRTADSVRKGDRVTVLADDLTAEAWLSTDTDTEPGPGPGSLCGPARSPPRWPSTPYAPATPTAGPPA